MILETAFTKRLETAVSIRAQLSWDLRPGAVAFLSAPSGSGKTFTLQAIHGSARPDAGHIKLDRQILFQGDGQRYMEAQNRSIGLVPSRGNLMLGKNVAWNLSSILAHWPTRSRGQRVAELLDRVGLASSATRHVSMLDAHQRWLLLLAQALAPRPSLLLLDDPFKTRLQSQERQRLMDGLRTLFELESVPALVGVRESNDLARPGERVFGLEIITKTSARRPLAGLPAGTLRPLSSPIFAVA